MSDITLRLVKGSPLTNQEVDDNFANLNTDKYESGDSASFQDLTLDGMSGPLTWNVDEGTLDVPLNAQVTLQAGQEFVFYAKATEAINNGDVVMFAGAQGGHLLIAKCDMGAVGFDPSHIVGVATQSFAINDFGYVTSSGKVRGIDTSGFTEGTILYVDPTTAGGYTSTKPTPPNHIVQIAAVTRSHATQGTILTRVSHMPDTDEVPEGSTNLYFTDARAVSAIKADGDWNATNWNTAYGWGDHDGLYALGQTPAVEITDLDNASLKTGMYDVATQATSHPDSGSSYTLTHIVGGAAGSASQLAIKSNNNSDEEIYVRHRQADGTWNAWAEIWHSDKFANNSTNWDSAYTYSQIGHHPLSGSDLYKSATYPTNTFIKQSIETAYTGLTVASVGGVGVILDTNNNDVSDFIVAHGTTDIDTATKLFDINGAGQGATIYLDAETSRAPVGLTLHSTVADIDGAGLADGNFIDFKITDTNATFTPQARIGMLVKDYSGDGGIPSEGTGNFVISVGQGTDTSGNGTLKQALVIREDNLIETGADYSFTSYGNITASGGNSEQWNTAYGWGDHGAQGYATETYVDDAITDLVDSSPDALNTLNELAAALGDDANFSTTVTNSIATKANKAGDTFTGTVISTKSTIGSIGGAPTMSNAGFLAGTTTTGLGIDSNEIVYVGTGTSYLNVVHDAGFEIHTGAGTENNAKRLTVNNDGIQVSGTIQATGYNNTNWDTAYTYSQVGHLPLVGGTLTGNITAVNATLNGGDLRIYNDASNYGQILFGESATDGNVILEYDGTGSGDTNYFHIYSDVSGWMTKGSSLNIQPSTGKIDIGATTFTEKFNVDGNVNFTGTISASGYNNSNWDTAHGWGNHATAGYLTSYTETSTLDDVCDRGATTDKALQIGGSSVSGGRFLAQNYTGSNKLVSLSSEYSSGALILGYGAEGKPDEVGYVSTYGNFTGRHSALKLSASGLDWLVDDSASQTAIGADLTLSNKFSIASSGDITSKGNLILNSATPEILFNGTSDAGVDMAIKATPEGLDFYEPEDVNKIHFQIFDDTGVNAVFGLQVGGTEVITSSRNLTNIGTISSGDITANGLIISDTNGIYIGYYDTGNAQGNWSQFVNNNHADTVFGTNLYLNGSHDLVTSNTHSSIRGSAMVATGNNHSVGAGALAFYAQGSGSATQGTVVAEEDWKFSIKSNAVNSKVGYQVNGTTAISSGREANFDTRVEVNNVDSTGNPTPDSQHAILSGYGLIGNRGTFYLTNAGGDVQIGNGAAHANSPTCIFNTTAVALQGTRVLQVGGSTVIDDSQNFTGASATLTSDSYQLNLKTVTNQAVCGISFSDNAPTVTQSGNIRYYHADSSSYGSGNAFVLSGDQPTMTVLADGKLMFKEGLYVKPSSGTGAGTLVMDSSRRLYAKRPIFDSESSADDVLVSRWRYADSDAYQLNIHQRVTSGVVRWSFGQVNASTTYADTLVLDRGKIGVGVQTPTEKMDISGNVKVTGDIKASGDIIASGNAPFIVIENSAETQSGIIFNDLQAGAYPAASSQRFQMTYDSGGTNLFRMGHDDGSYFGLTIDIENKVNINGALDVRSERDGCIKIYENTGSSGATFVDFLNNTGGTRYGRIIRSFSSLSYSTSSDYRLKDNVVPLDNAIARVNQLDVHRFNFIEYPDRVVDGFLAHEVQDVVPEAVDGEKDEVDTDGNPVYQAIDQSKLVPLLTAGLQEALAEIENLKQRLDALEN